MKDMAVQMQALDDFVTRARSQNERHHKTHVRSLQGMASTVRQSYTSMDDHFISTSSRVRDLGDDMADRNKSLQNTLPPLNTSVCQPLSELRANITNVPLKEYVPTGETPSKVVYTYPTTLPRTEAHEKLLTKLSKVSHATPSSPADISSTPPSPSKSIIYTDAAPVDEIALLQSSDSEPKPTNISGAHAHPGGSTTGLREVHININAALPALRTSDPAITQETMLPPPLKRHATMESKLPQKFGVKGVVRVEGRENSLPSLGAGRRLRRSPKSE